MYGTSQTIDVLEVQTLAIIPKNINDDNVDSCDGFVGVDNVNDDGVAYDDSDR